MTVTNLPFVRVLWATLSAAFFVLYGSIFVI